MFYKHWLSFFFSSFFSNCFPFGRSVYIRPSSVLRVSFKLLLFLHQYYLLIPSISVSLQVSVTMISTPLMIILLSCHGNCTVFFKVTPLLGYQPQDLLGKSVYNYYHPNDNVTQLLWKLYYIFSE